MTEDGIVIRATDQSFMDPLTFIKGYPDCVFVFSKSSGNRIALKNYNKIVILY